MAKRLAGKNHGSTGKRLLAGLWLLACCALDASAGHEIILARNEGNAAHQRFLESFRDNLPGVRIHNLAPGPTDRLRLTKTPAELIVTIGGKAARKVLSRRPSRPVIMAMIPRSAYEKMAATGVKHTALFIDQPLQRRVRLARALMPDARRIGIFAHAGNDALRREMLALDDALADQLVTRWLTDDDLRPGRLYEAINQGLDEMDVLVAIPDRRIYNSKTVRSLLIGAYRRRIPVIGFSHSFTQAGALASIYTRPGDFALQAAGMVKHYLEKQGLPAPQFPVHYSISTNPAVARSLRLDLPPAARLKKMAGGQDAR